MKTTRSFRNMIVWELVGVTALMVANAAAVVTFDSSVTIASGAQVGAGNIALDAYAPGAVDIAWLDSSGIGRYSSVTNFRSLAVNGESFLAGGIASVNDIMGISRDGGTVRIGTHRAGGPINEFTRTGLATWSSSAVGTQLSGAIVPAGTFDVDPTTGHGGFLYVDTSYNLVYVHENPTGTWISQTLQAGVTSGLTDYGSFNDFLYETNGNALVAYKSASGPSGGGLYAGMIGGSITRVTYANPTYHVALAASPDGTLHLLDDLDTTHTQYYVSTDGGATWTFKSQIVNFGIFNTSKDDALAVNPVNGMLAALVYDSSSKLTLATSSDGLTWNLQQLGVNAGVQMPDLAFDPAGHLFVAYYDTADDSLHLLSTIPEPSMVVLFGLGGLLIASRRRRKNIKLSSVGLME